MRRRIFRNNAARDEFTRIVRVTYCDVPQTFGVTPYRYSRTRRIVRVVEQGMIRKKSAPHPMRGGHRPSGTFMPGE